MNVSLCFAVNVRQTQWQVEVEMMKNILQKLATMKQEMMFLIRIHLRNKETHTFHFGCILSVRSAAVDIVDHQKSSLDRGDTMARCFHMRQRPTPQFIGDQLWLWIMRCLARQFLFDFSTHSFWLLLDVFNVFCVARLHIKRVDAFHCDTTEHGARRTEKGINFMNSIEI